LGIAISKYPFYLPHRAIIGIALQRPLFLRSLLLFESKKINLKNFAYSSITTYMRPIGQSNSTRNIWRPEDFDWSQTMHVESIQSHSHYMQPRDHSMVQTDCLSFYTVASNQCHLESYRTNSSVGVICEAQSYSLAISFPLIDRIKGMTIILI